MSQPTVNSRPATWAGTSNPILYKFTSTNYANAGYRMEVEIWDATAAAKIADAVYYANSSGGVTVDVSVFLKSSLSLDNQLTYSELSSELENDPVYINYYIKYQEIWTASSETQVNDSSNSRYAIYGGFQLGQINSYESNNYFGSEPFDFLSTTSHCAENHFLGLSFMKPIFDFRLYYKYYYGGTALGVSIDGNKVAPSSPNSILAFYYPFPGEIGGMKYDEVIFHVQMISLPDSDLSNGSNIDNPTGTINWTIASNPTVTLASAEQSEYFSMPFNSLNGTEYAITIAWSKVTGTTTGNATLVVSFADDSNTILGFTSASKTGADTSYSDELLLTPGGGNGTKIFISMSGINDDTDITLISITPGTNSSYVNVSNPLSLKIVEECQNTITLQWRNTLGGLQSHPFTFNQEYTFDYGNGKKAKRLTLYADDLTLNQWEAIQGLNTTGDRYRTPITELTTSLNRTSAQIGQSVYVLNSDGSKTGVVVIPQANTTFTKQKKHQARVTIEYPEIFLQ